MPKIVVTIEYDPATQRVDIQSGGARPDLLFSVLGMANAAIVLGMGKREKKESASKILTPDGLGTIPRRNGGGR